MPMTKAEFDAAFPEAKPNPEFEAWMAKVNAAIKKELMGLDSSDLPDWDYFTAFEEGMAPKKAAAAAIRAVEETY